MRLLLLAGTKSVYAVGTPAGTVISSRAVAMYTTASGANVDTVYSPFVVFVVKQAGTVNVLLPSLAKTSGDGVNADYSLTILNSGNGTDKIYADIYFVARLANPPVPRYQRKRYFGCCRLQCGCHCINRFSQSRFKFQDYCPRGCSKQ